MKSLIVAAALASLILTTSQANAWMHHGGYGGWGHGYGWGHHYGWHRWGGGWGGGWGGACRLRCNPWRCWRVCW